MARGKKTSSKKIAEVVTEKLKKPDSSLKDISKKTGVNKQTVSDILKKEAKEILTSSDYSKKLIEENIQIIALTNGIIKSKLEMISKNNTAIAILSAKELRSLSGTADICFKQNQLLNGGNTENTEIKIKIIE